MLTTPPTFGTSGHEKRDTILKSLRYHTMLTTPPTFGTSGHEKRDTILKSLSLSYYANNTPNVRHISTREKRHNS